MAPESHHITSARGVVVVFKREVRALMQDKQALYLTGVFGVVFPFLVARSSIPRNGGALTLMMEVASFPFIAAFQAAVVAFAGEREHGTLGPLLATPLDNTSIFYGKLLGGYAPGFATSILGLAVATASFSPRARAALGVLPASAIAEAILLAFVAGFVMAVAGIIVGARARTLRGAQMIGGVVYLPLIVGMFFVGGLLVGHPMRGALALVGLLALGAAGVALASRLWRREEAIARV